MIVVVRIDALLQFGESNLVLRCMSSGELYLRNATVYTRSCVPEMAMRYAEACFGGECEGHTHTHTHTHTHNTLI